MKRGGKAPPICDQLFTSKAFAERALEKYLARTDRLGYAKYPSKDKDAQS